MIHDVMPNDCRLTFPLIKFHFAGGNVLMSVQVIQKDEFLRFLAVNRNVNTQKGVEPSRTTWTLVLGISRSWS